MSDSTKSTSRLIEEWQSGRDRHEVFESLFERYYGPIFHFFMRRSISHDESLDLAQETFLSVYRGLDNFRGEASFETWLFRIASNLWRSALRSRSTAKRSATEVSLDELHAETSTRGEQADAELERAWDQMRRRLPKTAPVGRPLVELLAQGPPSPEEALRLALETSRELAKLHAGGRVLSDLRVENVRIDPSGRAQLLDLGVAPNPKSFEIGRGGSAEEAVSDLYRSLAPEQIAREGLSERSNLFSLGVLLYEMFTGESPFRDATPLDTASRILSLDPPWVNEINPQVDPALASLIDRLLAKEPGDRPASALAVALELESILHGDDTSQKQGDTTHSPPIEEEIEQLYDEIICWTRDARTQDRDEKIDRAYARLRELQTAEAERHRELFEASLAMPIDAGAEILARARALRKEIEDLAASDVTARKPDSP